MNQMRCPECQQLKLVSEFYVFRSRRPNTLPCKLCQRARARLSYVAHRAKKTARVRERELDDPERYRVMHHARGAVARAVNSGRLIKPSRCEECGSEDRIECAHSDYSQPLAVRWLCRPCHRTWDKRQPKFVRMVF